MMELAQQAYEAYGESTGWKNFQGDPMPAWDDLPGSIRKAWLAAANAVVGEIDARVGELFERYVRGAQ